MIHFSETVRDPNYGPSMRGTYWRANRKAAEMGVLLNDPDNNDDEVRSLQKQVDSLA